MLGNTGRTDQQVYLMKWLHAGAVKRVFFLSWYLQSVQSGIWQRSRVDLHKKKFHVSENTPELAVGFKPYTNGTVQNDSFGFVKMIQLSSRQPKK